MISIRANPLAEEYGLSNLLHSEESVLHKSVDSQKRPYIIGHYPTKSCFYIRYGNETKGVLKYKMTGKEIIDFYHTYVEEEERGKGIGNLLAKAGMEYVVEKDLKAKLSCSFMQKFVDEACLPIYYDRAIYSYPSKE
ncbi:protein NATD1-like [Symsagittifera roscoffensis]|uniref:protein NATD1-like n=1 Tax=Symsagittifera roscoffensis TaxID=84072 RepID=UPI00307BCE85